VSKRSERNNRRIEEEKKMKGFDITVKIRVISKDGKIVFKTEDRTTEDDINLLTEFKNSFANYVGYEVFELNTFTVNSVGIEMILD